MRPEVISKRFEISNRFEKTFRLHGNLTTANLKPFSKIVQFAWQFHCGTFPNDGKILLYMHKLWFLIYSSLINAKQMLH